MNKIVHLMLVAAALTSAQTTVTLNQLPTREFGQPKLPLPSAGFQLDSFNENYVEGREVNHPTSVAVDKSASPSIVYVADTNNNRVLGFKNSAALTKGNFADLVIGQRSLTVTNPQGPGVTGSTFSTGLQAPTAIAVDSKGNLYVADSGNNRILRYPTPFSQNSSLLPVDLVIGQTSSSSGRSANEGNSIPSAKSLSLSSGSTIYVEQMAFDATGNLWVTDAGNNRVLRFPVAALAANTTEPAADIVLGHADFVTATFNGANANSRSKDRLNQPAGLAFDQAGRLYVSDSYLRVLIYYPVFASGIAAARVLGIPLTPAGQTVFTYPTQYTLGLLTNQGSSGPTGLFTIGNNLFVCDSPVNRIIEYDTPENWPTEVDTAFSPPAIAVYGQPDYTSLKANHGATDPDAFSFANPSAGAVNGTEVLIVDNLNNRVLSLPLANGNLTAATRVIGQLDFTYNASNLIEGKELFIRNGGAYAGGIAIDRNSNPPHLYVADTFNNRILGFNDARAIGTDFRSVLTTKADIVIGQPDLFHADINYPNTDSTKPNDSGLFYPIGIAVDAAGNLFVADSGNARILRFPAPFSQPPTGVRHANLLLGQVSFTSTLRDPNQITMSEPWGLAILSDGSLAASDAIHNRVLLFRKPSSGDFASSQAASIELGQPDFSSTGSSPNTSSSGFNSPRGIGADTSDRLYVADTANNRVMVFSRLLNQGNNATSALQIPGLNSPLSVTVSPNTGELWVANTSSSQLLRYPVFETLVSTSAQPTATLSANLPAVVALDTFDNVIALEASNRMTFYFPQLTYRNSANYNQQPVAPGMLLNLARIDGIVLKTVDGDASSIPYPTTLSNYQVIVNGVAAPVFSLRASGIIKIQVPTVDSSGNPTPTSGTVDFVVTDTRSSQIVAVGNFQMQAASPGFYTVNAQGTGQVAALNAVDGSPNSPANKVGRGQYISLFLTGQGLLPNSPPDGSGAKGAVPTPDTPVVILQPGPPSPLPAGNIQYSGLAPGFPGLWQINVLIPDTVLPNDNVLVVVTLKDVPSNIGPSGPSVKLQTTIAVK